MAEEKTKKEEKRTPRAGGRKDRSKTERKRETREEKKAQDIQDWKPKTSLGLKVKNGEIKDIDDILDAGLKILEPEITEILLPALESDLLLVGQSKGKFGGGKRRIFKQTQKKTNEGNKPQFSTFAVVGNKDGYMGAGYGKSRETVPAREKALRNAKLNIFKISRGCGSWECGCGEVHTIPFSVQGKCGSVIVKLMPAPKGKGLVAESEIQKIFRLVGIKDILSKSLGHTSTKSNFIRACISALKQTISTKISYDKAKSLGIVEGKVAVEEEVLEQREDPPKKEEKGGDPEKKGKEEKK